MPRLRHVTIGHPLAQEAKKHFEKRRRKKLTLSFEKLFTLFAADEVSFAEIATESGLSRQAVSATWKKYFAELFPGRVSGFSRRSADSFQRLQTALATQGTANDSIELTELIALLREEGLCVQRFSSTRAKTFQTRFLKVGGFCCAVSIIRATHRIYKRSYWHLMTPQESVLATCRFLLCVVNSHGEDRSFFVIPVSILQQVRSSIFIPIGGYSGYNNNFPKIDYYQYKDAWHLLREAN